MHFASEDKAKEYYRLRHARRMAEDPEGFRRKQRASRAKRRARDPEKFLLQSRESVRRSREKDRERDRALSRAWAQKNKPRRAAWQRARNAAKAQACPSWARTDPRIEALYFIRDWLQQQGDAVHVDHLFPLRPQDSDAPVGLHVYCNLRLVLAQENAIKHCRQPSPEEITEQRLRDFP
jgi:hypothetical protein